MAAFTGKAAVKTENNIVNVKLT